MGMPITIEVIDASVTEALFNDVFDYFTYVDETFSPFKETSEISKINKGEVLPEGYSDDMRTILRLCEETTQQTQGYFNIITPSGLRNPSGVVKGWAINNAARIIADRGYDNFYVEAGGDIEVSRKEGLLPWRVGIRNPFNLQENVAILGLLKGGVATSGTYIRGQHIYDPFQPNNELHEIVSLTVIGPNIYDADRFATAAFAMQHDGIMFIEKLEGFEGYSIDAQGIATKTSGFNSYVIT